MDVPAVVCGDFNANFVVGDKVPGIPNLVDIQNANAYMHDMDLREPSSVGRQFTWTNGQSELIWLKLDYILVNNAWVDRILRLIQNSMLRVDSDHVPILLEVGRHYSNPRPFRFEVV